MTAFFDLVGEYFRYWPYVLAGAVGVMLALIDRKIFGRAIFSAVLAVLAIGGFLTTYLSPFTFQGGDDYIRGLIVGLMALAGLAGYALAVGASCVNQKLIQRGAQ
ncbi:MAG TPA: hypothetical protein PLD46_03295 [Hyphomicrobium sp.]|nr:hypothetical protein [Hyphomicrobium sp.]